MTISHLSFRVPYSAGRDCMIVIRPQNEAYQAVCVDTATRLPIGSPLIPRAPGGGRPVVTADDVLRLIGGMYGLASVAVDIEADELARQTGRVSDQGAAAQSLVAARPISGRYGPSTAEEVTALSGDHFAGEEAECQPLRS